MVHAFSRLVLAILAAAWVAAAPPAQCGLTAAAGEPLAYLRGDVANVTVWDPDGPGPAVQHLVATGWFDVGLLQGVAVAMWDGSSWTSANAPFEAAGVSTVWNGRLVVAGSYVSSMYITSEVWSFDGASWTLLGSSQNFLPMSVLAMTVFNGDLVVTGNFAYIVSPTQGQVFANRVAKWNGSSWSALGNGPLLGTAIGATAHAAAVFNNGLWVGLEYTTFPPTLAGGVQVWNGSAWLVVGATDGPVETLASRIGSALTNSFLFAGGRFSQINGVAASFVARFTPTTNTWAAIGAPPAASSVTNCEQLFVRATGINTYELVGTFRLPTPDKAWRWTGAWSALPDLVDDVGAVNSVRVHYHGGRYVAAIRNVIDPPMRGLRGHDSAAGSWKPVYGAGFAGDVHAVCRDGAQLVVGGDFATISGSVVNRIVRGAPGNWQTIGSGFANGTVSAVARLVNGDLVAGGDFTMLGDGTPTSRIARWNGVAWTSLGLGVDGAVRALLPLPNGELLVGGEFGNAGGQPASRIARWNGSTWSPLGAGCTGIVFALLRRTNGDVVAGGAFTFAGGQSANHVARWDGAGWSSYGSGVDGDVYALTESDDGIVAGGAFQFSAVYPAAHLARWDGTGTTWYPFGTYDQPDRPVRALATSPGGETVIGGDAFEMVNPIVGAAPTCAAVWRGTAWHSLGVSGARVSAMVMGDDSLVLGGDFARAVGTASANVASFVTTCPASAATFAAGCASSGGGNTLAAVTLPWASGALRTRGTGLPATAIVLVLTSITPVVPPVPLSALLGQGVPGCNLHVAPDILQAIVTTNGTAESVLQLPNVPPIVGVTFHQQMLPIELDALGSWVAITATNALQLTGGFF